MKTLKRLKLPLIVAPMAGGPSSVDLVTATCEAGALGSIGAAYMSGNQIEEFCAKLRERTQAPFAINLFVPNRIPRVSRKDIEAAIVATADFRTELNLPPPNLTAPYEQDFVEQFKAVLQAKPSVISYVFGCLPEAYVKAAKAKGIELIGNATTCDEAMALMREGADGVVLQGIEAGGHRAIFEADSRDQEVPLTKLLQQCRNLNITRIAAGGIMNRADVAAAMDAGAAAVQMGTAFLCCEEAGTAAGYREKLLSKVPFKTRTTRAFSGRLARGIENKFMLEMETRATLPFPLQNKFTRDIRATGNGEFLSLWAGTGTRPLWTGRTADLIEELFFTEVKANAN